MFTLADTVTSQGFRCRGDMSLFTFLRITLDSKFKLGCVCVYIGGGGGGAMVEAGRPAGVGAGFQIFLW